MTRDFKRILILGGNGRIGSLAAQHMQARLPHAQVIRCVRKPAQEPGEWLQFDPFQDDWDCLPPCDLLVNAAGAIQATKEMPFSRVHEGLTALMLQHRAALGQPRILQISALGADAAHEVDFLATKGRADAMLLAEPDTAVVRPSIVCTPGTMLSQKLGQLLKIARLGLGKLLVPAGFGQAQVQPVDPDDLGALIAAVALDDRFSGIVDAVGPAPLRFEEILQEMAQAQGRKIRLVAVPREIIETFVKHFVSVWFPGMLNYDQFRLLFQDNTADPGPAEAILGRKMKDTLPFWRGVVEDGPVAAVHAVV